MVLDDFDAIREVSPEWEHLHHQVGRGRQRTAGVLAQTPWMQLATLSRTPGARIQGAAPAGTTVLAASLHGARIQVQGEGWGRETLGFLRGRCEFEMVAPEPHAELVLTIATERLDAAAVERFGEPLRPPQGSSLVRLRGPESLRRIVATSARWLRAMTVRPALLLDPAVAAAMESEVLESFLEGVDRQPAPAPARPRRELARRAETFLRDSIRDAVRLQDVCDAVGASSRAVHAAFHDVYGIPPKAYWKALRLSAARADLLRARPGTTVSEVAARWGFFQFGYFSVDYRRMFGEQPRETLARGLHSRVSHVVVRPAASPAV
ncbi:MAG TPA: helix-turn-helix domain-containing protein [Anaeromyxobacteraceae bacterium]|nr:helix-turn-helix domain-containing protein [Anaeromyxobacteraceae bacterium]